MKLIQISSSPVRFIRPDRVTEVSEEPDTYGRSACTAVRFLDGTAMYLPTYDVFDVAQRINDALAEQSHGPQPPRPSG